MSDQFAHQIMRIAVAQICRSKEFGDFDTAAEGHAFDTFVDVIGKYIEKIGRLCRTYAEHDGRTESNFLDLLQAFDRLEPNRVDWRDLERMCKEIPWQVPYTTGIPVFPVDKRPRRAQQYGEKRKSEPPSSTAADLLASAKKRQKTGADAEAPDAATSAPTANGDAAGEEAATPAANGSAAPVDGSGAGPKTDGDTAATKEAGAGDANANGTADGKAAGTDDSSKTAPSKDDKMDVDDSSAKAPASGSKSDKDATTTKKKKSKAKGAAAAKDAAKQEDTLEHPLFVPSHFPSFPERYTYSYTYVDATTRETDPKAILERSLEDKRRVQEALVRISQGTGSATPRAELAFGEPADDATRGGPDGAGAAPASAAPGAASSSGSLAQGPASGQPGGGPSSGGHEGADALPSLPNAFS